MVCRTLRNCSFFFFNDTATTEIYTLSLHDALPICPRTMHLPPSKTSCSRFDIYLDRMAAGGCQIEDRKSTRLNSSHQIISYAVFCLKKKNTPLIFHSTLQHLVPRLIAVEQYIRS